MNVEKTYWFFNLLILGLLTSEFYLKTDRSQRVGLALGLIIVGLLTALRIQQSKEIIRRHWLATAGVIILIVSLTCTGEQLWHESQFKVILMSIMIIMGLLSTWVKGEWGNLPPIFWLFLSGGAVAANFILGLGYVDLGAYIGAWLWLIFGAVSSLLEYPNEV